MEAKNEIQHVRGRKGWSVEEMGKNLEHAFPRTHEGGRFQESVGGVERDGKENRLKRVKTEEKNDVFS